MRAMVLFAVLMCAVLVHCGGSNNGPPTVATTKSNVCDQIAAVACYDMYNCCTEGQIERSLGITDPETQSQCQDDVKRSCDIVLAGPLNSIAQGRATFNGANLDTCLKALLVPTAGCGTVDQADPWIAACMMSPIVGAVADGGQCNFNFECSMTSTCAPDQKCTPLGTEGQPCAGGCAPGFFCGNAGLCTALLGPNAPCTSAAACQKGLFCDFSATPTPICSAQKDPGQACNQNQACKNNDCLPGTCQGLGFTCFNDAQCGMRCSNVPTLACNTDCSLVGGGCGTSTCSVSGAACCTTTNCGSAGGTCGTPPGQCRAVTCTGDIVCANLEVTVSYCAAGQQALALVGL
jgi:hypothetical protein